MRRLYVVCRSSHRLAILFPLVTLWFDVSVLGADPPAAAPQAQVMIQVRMVKMPRETAHDLFGADTDLGTVGIVPKDVLSKLRQLEKRKRAIVLAEPAILTISGNAAQVRSVQEVMYLMDYDPPQVGDSTSGAAQFKTREVGTLLNVTPTVSADGRIVNITAIPELCTMAKPDPIQGTSNGRKLSMQVPRFRSVNFTTALVLPSGATALVSVVEPNDAPTSHDELVLMFLTATIAEIK